MRRYRVKHLHRAVFHFPEMQNINADFSYAPLQESTYVPGIVVSIGLLSSSLQWYFCFTLSKTCLWCDSNICTCHMPSRMEQTVNTTQGARDSSKVSSAVRQQRWRRLHTWWEHISIWQNCGIMLQVYEPP